DFLLSLIGAVLLANHPWVRRGATPAELARHVARRVYRSKPFFVTAPITQAIFSASRSLPEYTFTAESFPCSKPFVWLQERLRCARVNWSFLDHVVLIGIDDTQLHPGEPTISVLEA